MNVYVQYVSKLNSEALFVLFVRTDNGGEVQSELSLSVTGGFWIARG